MGSLMRLISDVVRQDNCRLGCDPVIIITILLLFIHLFIVVIVVFSWDEQRNDI